jgi:hypothetical protein
MPPRERAGHKPKEEVTVIRMMAFYSRKFVAVCVALILVFATCYWVVAKLEPSLSPLERVEALVAPFTVEPGIHARAYYGRSAGNDRKRSRAICPYDKALLLKTGLSFDNVDLIVMHSMLPYRSHVGDAFAVG